MGNTSIVYLRWSFGSGVDELVKVPLNDMNVTSD